MSSMRMVRREKKRAVLQQKYAKKRVELREKLNAPELSIEDKFMVLAEYEKMPKDASKTRGTRRCRITGRARGVYKNFMLCRHKIREMAMLGYFPGLVKSSW